MNPFDRVARNQQICRYDTEYIKINPDIVHHANIRNLNIIGIDESTPIYRIYTLDRFLDLVKNRKNTLVRPKLWDDTFENFILNSKGHSATMGDVGFDPIRDCVYGQCWSLNKESDGLWRTYTDGKRIRAVKVKTTVGKLFESFYDMTKEYHLLSYFIGKVEYVDMPTISQRLYEGFASLTDRTGISQPLTLLIKRSEFSYENEVRLIYIFPDSHISGCLPDIWQYPIDPNVVFEDVVLDPWTPDSLISCEKSRIAEAGYTGLVSMSDLYTPNNNVIQMP